MSDYSAGTASVDIKPDFRYFVKRLRRELDQVRAELGVDIKPATAGFADALDTYLQGVSARLGVEINPDTAGFATELDTYLQGVVATLGIGVVLDESSWNDFKVDLETRVAALHPTITLQVDADTANAADEIAAFRTLAGSQMTIGLDADTAMAASEIAAFRQLAGGDITLGVDADTTAARAEIQSLNGSSVSVNVNTNSSGGRGAGDGLRTAGMLNAGALALGNLPAAATLIATIGADVQALAQSALVLPGLFAGAAAGITTMAVGMNGLKDAFSDSPKKAAAAYAGLSAEGKQLVDTTKSFGDQWSRISDRVQDVTLDGLSESTKTLLDNQLPGLEKGMTAVAGKLNEGAKIAMAELGNEQSQGALSRIFGNTAESAGILNGAVTPVISSIRTLAGEGSSSMPRLAQSFTDAATRLDGFLTRSQQSGDLSRWIDEGIDSVGKLVSILGNLGSTIGSVLGAAKGDGEGFLTTVDNLTERMSNWATSAEGQTALRTFFIEGRQQLEQWQPVLAGIGGTIVSVYEGAKAWSAVLMPFLGAAFGLLSEHGTIVKTVLVAWLAYRTIAPIVTGIQSAIAGATTRMQTFQSTMAATQTAGATPMMAGLKGVAAALGTGGILGIAMIAAGVGLSALANKHQEAKQAAAEQQAALEALGATLDETTGKVTEQTIAHAADTLEKGGYLERAKTLGIDTNQLTRASLGLDPQGQAAINSRLTQVIMEQRESAGTKWDNVQDWTGLTDQDIAQALQGVPEAVTRYADALTDARARIAAQGGETRLSDLASLKDSLNDVGESAATLGGQMNGLDTETAKLGESVRRTNEAQNGTHQLTQQGIADFQALGLAVSMVPDAKTVIVNSTTDEQKAKLEELGYQVTRLPDGTVKIVLNDEQAKLQIAELTKPESKTITITAGTPAAAGQDRPVQAPDSYPRGADGRRLPGRATGGTIVGPGTGTSDSILGIDRATGVPTAWVSNREEVIAAEPAEKWRWLLKAVNSDAPWLGRMFPRLAEGGTAGWDTEDELKLQEAINDVQLKIEKRDRLNFDGDASDAKKRDADIEIEKARTKVQKLEDKKAGRDSSPVGSTIMPQAELPGRMSEDKISVGDAEYAVDKANTERNQVHADPDSTAEEKAAADRAYLSAQNALQKLYDKGATGTGEDGLPEEYSLKGIFSKAGGILADGLLSALGLENSILSGSNPYNKALNSAVDFYGDKAQAGQDGQPDTGGYTYQPKNLPVTDNDTSSSSDSSSSSGTSSGTGGDGSDHTYDPAGGVEQWRGVFSSVLRALGLPGGWVDLGLQQMRTESGGNPKAINNWDSNAAKGTPSKGLMQVIDPTFQANRSEKYPNDIWNPGANIAASLQYTVNRYGGPEGVWGQGHGYRDGGWVAGVGSSRVDSVRARLAPREFVTRADRAAANAPWLEAINAGLDLPPIDSLGTLPALPAGLAPRGGDTSTSNSRDHSVNFHAPVQVMDVGHLMREQDRWVGVQSMAALVTH